VISKKLEELVFLTPTDTTIGFVSQNADRLTTIKCRPPHKHYIKALPSVKSLKTFIRVPEKHKNRVRRSKRSTFVFPDGHSYRVIKACRHHVLIEKLGWAYTTSANISGLPYSKKFARQAADIIVDFPSEADKGNASKIFKLNNMTIKRLR